MSHRHGDVVGGLLRRRRHAADVERPGVPPGPARCARCTDGRRVVHRTGVERQAAHVLRGAALWHKRLLLENDSLRHLLVEVHGCHADRHSELLVVVRLRYHGRRKVRSTGHVLRSGKHLRWLRHHLHGCHVCLLLLSLRLLLMVLWYLLLLQRWREFGCGVATMVRGCLLLVWVRLL